MWKAPFSGLFILLVLVFSSGAGGYAADTPAPNGPAVVSADAADIIRTLGTPELGENAVRLLLSHLGIGIYTPDGRQVQAGSETGESDFWVYDFQIPMLLALSEAPRRPFAGLLAVLAAAGIETDADELAALYREVYAANSEASLVRFLLASGLDLDNLDELTGLQEWLLALDTLMPPNQTQDASAGRPVVAGATPLTALVSGLPAFGGSVSAVRGFLPAGPTYAGAETPYYGPALSGWGFAFGAANYGEVVAAEAAFRALNSILFNSALSVRLTADPDLVHEGHGGPGETATLEVEVVSSFAPVAVPLTYGHLAALPLPGLTGPLEGAEVHWSIPELLESRGTISQAEGAPYFPGAPAFTGMEGTASLVFQAQQEEADGYGDEVWEMALVQAEVDVRPALLRAGVDPVFVHSYIRPSFHALTPFTVEWHEDDSPIRIRAHLHFEQTETLEGVELSACSASWSHKARGGIMSLAELAEHPPDNGLELGTVVVALEDADALPPAVQEELEDSPDRILLWVSRPQQIENPSYQMRWTCHCGLCNYPAEVLSRSWGGALFFDKFDEPVICILADGDDALIVYYLPEMHFLHPGWPACEGSDPIEPGTECGLYFYLLSEIPPADRPPGADRSTMTYRQAGIVVLRLPMSELYSDLSVTETWHFEGTLGEITGSLRITVELVTGEAARG